MGYDALSGSFRLIFFSNNGPFTEEGNRYEGKVSDARLTSAGLARFQYELDDEGKIKTNADSTWSVCGSATRRASGRPGWISSSRRSAPNSMALPSV